MTPAARTRVAHALLVVAPILWSAHHLVVRWVGDWFPPHQLTFWRWLVALIPMLVVAGPALWRDREVARSEWRTLLLLGALGMWITGVAVAISGRTTTATNIGLVYSVAPVLIILLSAVVYRERLLAVQVIGTLVAFAGVVAIVIRGDPQVLVDLTFTPGDFWVMLAAVAWAVYSVILRYRPTRLDLFARLAAIMAGGVIILAPLAAVEAVVVGMPPATTQAFVAALILGLSPGFGAYMCYSWLVREIGTARTGLMIYVVPLYNALFGAWLLDERPGAYHAIGGALIFLGIWLANRAPPRT